MLHLISSCISRHSAAFHCVEQDQLSSLLKTNQDSLYSGIHLHGLVGSHVESVVLSSLTEGIIFRRFTLLLHIHSMKMMPTVYRHRNVGKIVHLDMPESTHDSTFTVLRGTAINCSFLKFLHTWCKSPIFPYCTGPQNAQLVLVAYCSIIDILNCATLAKDTVCVVYMRLRVD